MPSFGKAIFAFMTSSFIGTLTQVGKGKLSAVFLSTEGVGIYNQVSQLFSLLMTLCVLGFPNGISRNVAIEHEAKNWDEVRSHFSSFFFFIGTVSLLVSAIGVIFSAQISHLILDDKGQGADLVALVMLGVPFGALGYIYRALLNGTRSVKTLVRSRVTADVLSVAAFAALIIPFGITGAVLGFISLQLLYFVVIALGVRSTLPWLGRPKLKAFRITAIRKDLGYGLHGLAVAVVGGLTTLIVSRWIISNSNVSDSGLFNVAYKVASVYLAGMYAAASGHYYASVAQASTQKSVNEVVNSAIRIYMAIIPPVVGALIAGGDLLMIIFFSTAFVPAAALLILLLPGDIFRLVSEIIGQALVAKKRLLISFLIYCGWVVSYLLLSRLLIQGRGIAGAAEAYLLSQLFLFAVMVLAGYFVLSYRPDRETVLAFLRGLALAGCCAVSTMFLTDRLEKILAGAVFICVWFGISMLDIEFNRLVRGALTKVLQRIAPANKN